MWLTFTPKFAPSHPPKNKKKTLVAITPPERSLLILTWKREQYLPQNLHSLALSGLETIIMGSLCRGFEQCQANPATSRATAVTTKATVGIWRSMKTLRSTAIPRLTATLRSTVRMLKLMTVYLVTALWEFISCYKVLGKLSSVFLRLLLINAFIVVGAHVKVHSWAIFIRVIQYIGLTSTAL